MSRSLAYSRRDHMKYELRELHMSMGQPEYEMYQDIPVKEPGSTNLCKGLPYGVFKEFLEGQIARKYQTVSFYDTPTITYLLYVEGTPVGYIGIRTQIDDNWKKWCGNIYYAVRLSERRKGYGTKMLELALEECRKLGFREIHTNASAGNIASARVIENNGGIFLEEINGSRHYRIVI